MYVQQKKKRVVKSIVDYQSIYPLHSGVITVNFIVFYNSDFFVVAIQAVFTVGSRGPYPSGTPRNNMVCILRNYTLLLTITNNEKIKLPDSVPHVLGVAQNLSGQATIRHVCIDFITAIT